MLFLARISSLNLFSLVYKCSQRSLSKEFIHKKCFWTFIIHSTKICCTLKPSTVEPRYNEDLGTMEIALLHVYPVSPYIRVKKQQNTKSWDQQNYLVITVFCYIQTLYNKVPLYYKIRCIIEQNEMTDVYSVPWGAVNKIFMYFPPFSSFSYRWKDMPWSVQMMSVFLLISWVQ